MREAVNLIQEIGRVVTVGAIGAIVTAVLLMMVTNVAITLAPTTGLIYLLMLLTCGQLYIGSNWARWIVGILLVLIGAGWSYLAIISIPAAVTPFRIVYVGVAVMSVSFGLALLILRQVKHFLADQRTNRSPLARRVLQSLWVIAALGMALLIVNDVTRLLGG